MNINIFTYIRIFIFDFLHTKEYVSVVFYMGSWRSSRNFYFTILYTLFPFQYNVVSYSDVIYFIKIDITLCSTWSSITHEWNTYAFLWTFFYIFYFSFNNIKSILGKKLSENKTIRIFIENFQKIFEKIQNEWSS